MARKKIQKAPKENRADEEEDQQEESQHADEPAQEPAADEPEPEQEPATKTKAPKKTKATGKHKDASGHHESKAEAVQVHLFSDEFTKRIEGFKSFYQEYLQLRASSGDADNNGEFNKVNEATRRKIESACLTVLREDVGDAQKWVHTQQELIRQQISSVEKLETDMRTSLESTKTFSVAEMDQPLEAIRRKKQSLEQSLARLEEIKTRANQIYQHSSSGGHKIDEQ